MRTFVKVSLVSVAVLAAACGTSEPEQGARQLTDDLQRDLQAASSATVELAATARDYQPTRFVSAIEAPPRASAPARRSSAPRRVVRPAAEQPAAARAPDVTPATEVAAKEQVSEQTTEAPAPAAEASETPADVAVAPRPTPVEATIPAPGDAAGGGSGPGIGETIGTVIGVVIIRGGAGGIDHCVPRRPTRRPGAMPGVPIAVNTPFPGGISGRLPIPTRGTFPRR